MAAVLIAALFVVPFPASVSGDHGGRPIGSYLGCDRPVIPPRCTSVGNNLFHGVVFDETLTEGLASSLRDSLAEDYGATKIVPVVQPEVTDSTDVIAYSEDYGDNGAAGWVYCPSDAPQGTNFAGDRWCQQQQMHFNLNPRYAIFFADDASRDHVTCHELGHTVGLRHWGNPPETDGPPAETCMQSNTPNGPTDLHQIDRDHIDGYRLARPPARAPSVRFISEVLLDAPETAAAWAGATADALELEHFATLPDLVIGADAVVRGRITSVEAGREFGGATGVPFSYAAATIQVDELLSGALPPDHRAELTLEIPLFGGDDALAALQADVSGAERVFFLRNKGASARAAGMSAAEQSVDAEFYRLVTQRSVLEDHDGLATLPAGEDASLAGLLFDDAVTRIRRAAS